jgi:hypothetical protein
MLKDGVEDRFNDHEPLRGSGLSLALANQTSFSEGVSH